MELHLSFFLTGKMKIALQIIDFLSVTKHLNIYDIKFLMLEFFFYSMY